MWEGGLGIGEVVSGEVESDRGPRGSIHRTRWGGCPGTRSGRGSLYYCKNRCNHNSKTSRSRIKSQRTRTRAVMNPRKRKRFVSLSVNEPPHSYRRIEVCMSRGVKTNESDLTDLNLHPRYQRVGLLCRHQIFIHGRSRRSFRTPGTPEEECRVLLLWFRVSVAR